MRLSSRIWLILNGVSHAALPGDGRITTRHPSRFYRPNPLSQWVILALAPAKLWLAMAASAADASSLQIHLSWGHNSPETKPYYLRIATSQIELTNPQLQNVEAGETLSNGVVRTTAGASDTDALHATLRFEPRVVNTISNAQAIWKHLWKFGDPEATRRLQSNPSYRPDARTLTFYLKEKGTRGFSLTMDQLLREQTFWFPEFNLFISTGDSPPSFNDHQNTLMPYRGRKVLDLVARAAEPSYSTFTSQWEDMGSPSFHNPHEVKPGHITGIGWDSNLYKFGIDRLAGAQSDYSKIDIFKLEFDFSPFQSDLARSWVSQSLSEGLPLLTTRFQKSQVDCEVEQFALPLDGPSRVRDGTVPMVLMQRMKWVNASSEPQTISVRLTYSKPKSLLSGPAHLSPQSGSTQVVLEDGAQKIHLYVEGLPPSSELKTRSLGGSSRDSRTPSPEWIAHDLVLNFDLKARESREMVVKLPSPTLPASGRRTLAALNFARSRKATVQFWNAKLNEGALFDVPDAAVNTLFRANLWHALRLPRRHGSSSPDIKIDLPYSNFAYDQTGTPWPVNQSVYVDYMIYDLRGHHAVSEEEHAVIFRNNQEANGHVGGFANWGVYTPGMLYSVAQHFLLSGDRESFDRLLPASLKALDWCLGELHRASKTNGPTPGLMQAPLNDLSHTPRSWAFNQAYFTAGIELFGRALSEIHHPRAEECRAAAMTLRESVEREFGRASALSPAVQLADNTWTVFVPCDAQTPGRQFKTWYPSDVDTGPLHLTRLKALDPKSPLATAMLHDHEDNLFIHQRGMINEPVYIQQANTYLHRDEPAFVVRAFYSMMACAFSHSVFEPVEHRWGWPQYFGPPSTDGAWFELYRNMLIHENDENGLTIGQATPRAWLKAGQRIHVERAPTYFGPLSFTMHGLDSHGDLKATIELSQRKKPASLLVRFRHPQGKPIKTVRVNGKSWTDFSPEKEWVRIPNPDKTRYVITVHD